MPMFKRVSTVLLIAVVIVGQTGCSSPTSPASSSDVQFAGTWTGTGRVTRMPFLASMTFSTATLTLVFAKQGSTITKAGVPLSGTWTMTSADPGMNKSGTLRMTAFMSRDCTGPDMNGVMVCRDSYTTLNIRDVLLSSSSACSTFYESALGLGNNNTMFVAVHNGQGATASDPTCGGSTPNRTYDYLAGDFTLTKQ